MAAIASAVGVALRHLTMQRNSKHQEKTLTHMLELMSSVVSGENPYASVCKSVQKYCQRLTEAERCRVYLVLNGTHLEMFAGEHRTTRVPVVNDVVGEVVRTGQEVWIKDSNSAKQHRCRTGHAPGDRTIFGMLCVPIHHAGQVVCVVQVCACVRAPVCSATPPEVLCS